MVTPDGSSTLIRGTALHQRVAHSERCTTSHIVLDRFYRSRAKTKSLKARDDWGGDQVWCCRCDDRLIGIDPEAPSALPLHRTTFPRKLSNISNLKSESITWTSS